MEGRTAPCLLTVALSSVLILIISRQLPCVCRVAPRGSSAACMVTAILEVSVGKVCASLVRLAWRDVLRFPADKERRGGRVKRFGSLKSAWLPVSRYEGFPVDSGTSFHACRLHMARDSVRCLFAVFHWRIQRWCYIELLLQWGVLLIFELTWQMEETFIICIFHMCPVLLSLSLD